MGEDLLAKLSGWETGKTELADVFTEERMLEYKGAYKVMENYDGLSQIRQLTCVLYHQHVVNNTDRSRATLEHELKTNRAFAAFVSREEKAPCVVNKRREGTKQ